MNFTSKLNTILTCRISDLWRIFRFAVVGLVAAATHYLSVLGIVEFSTVSPLLANIGGFCIAFWPSYFGHRFWTFTDQIQREEHSDQPRQAQKNPVQNPHKASLFKFLCTALFGFAFNELLFYCMLKWTDLPYTIALAIAVCVVAVSTYVLSRYWAFHNTTRHS